MSRACVIVWCVEEKSVFVVKEKRGRSRGEGGNLYRRGGRGGDLATFTYAKPNWEGKVMGVWPSVIFGCDSAAGAEFLTLSRDLDHNTPLGGAHAAQCSHHIQIYIAIEVFPMIAVPCMSSAASFEL